MTIDLMAYTMLSPTPEGGLITLEVFSFFFSFRYEYFHTGREYYVAKKRSVLFSVTRLISLS